MELISCNYADVLHLAGPFKEGQQNGSSFNSVTFTRRVKSQSQERKDPEGAPCFYFFFASFADLHTSLQSLVALA